MPSVAESWASAPVTLPAPSIQPAKSWRFAVASRTISRKVESATAATATLSACPTSLAGAAAPRSRTSRVARSSISLCTRSSSTVNRAATSASNGNCCRMRVQNAWIVCTLSPPGTSSAAANSVRARMRVAASIVVTPMSRMAASSAASSSAIQLRSVSNTRTAMLAAAALVKVMQRIFDGSTPPEPPCSISRITRCASTWVLPDPALAATNAAAPGSDAAACRRRTSSGMMRRALKTLRLRSCRRAPIP